MVVGSACIISNWSSVQLLVTFQVSGIIDQVLWREIRAKDETTEFESNVD